MTALASVALFAALGMSLWGAAVSILTYRSGDRRYLMSATRSLYAIAGLVSLSVAILISALVRDDFTVKYVWEYSRTTQPLVYKLTALWGGMSGSLLFWCFLVAVFSALAVTFNKKNNERILPFATLILFVTLAFFLILLNFKTNPFDPLLDESGAALASYPAEMLRQMKLQGNGLNPLLQNAYMAFHPPLLYMGLVGFTIPFAFLLGALAHKKEGTFWMRSVRNWALFSWLSLGAGILLGAYWAYIELGWGGYWAWDPVENASFLPWLTATAFLHSFIMQSKRGIYRIWNVCFIVATFLLSIYGTYLTRSGVLQSVHAFSQEDPSVPWYFKMGNIFLGYMGAMLAVSLYLLLARLPMLRPRSRIESAGSRESMVLYANLLFAFFTLVVLFGVSSPIFYRIFTGRELHHGPEYYNPRTIPISLAILLVMGVASIAPWRRGGFDRYKRNLVIPGIAGFAALGVSLALFFLNGAMRADAASRPKDYFYLVACVVFSAFVAALILEQYARAVLAASKRRGASWLLEVGAPFRENPRRYGGYVVHLGIVFIFLGVAFSSAFQQQYQENVKVGEAVRFGPYTARLASFGSKDMDKPLGDVNDQKIWANLELFKGDHFIGLLKPMRVFYPSSPEEPSYEVAIDSSLARDFYAVLAGYDMSKGTAILGVFVTPMVAWIWLGSIVLMIGGLITLMPVKRV